MADESEQSTTSYRPDGLGLYRELVKTLFLKRDLGLIHHANWKTFSVLASIKRIVSSLSEATEVNEDTDQGRITEGPAQPSRLLARMVLFTQYIC